MNEESLKLHKCALDWFERCVYCEIGYDETKRKISNENESLLKEKINEGISLLNVINDDCESQLQNELTNIEYELDLRLESLKEELDLIIPTAINDVTKAEQALCEGICEDFIKMKRIFEEILKDTPRQALNLKLDFIQSFFNLDIKMKFLNNQPDNEESYNLKLSIYANERFKNTKLLCDEFSFDCFELKQKINYANVEDVVYLNEEMMDLDINSNAYNYIIDKEANAKCHEKSTILRLNAQRFLEINADSTWLSLLNEKLELVSSFKLNGKHEAFEVLNERLVACIQNYNNIHIYSTRSDTITLHRVKNNTLMNYTRPNLTRLCDDKFGIVCLLSVKIFDFDGKTIKEVSCREVNSDSAALVNLTRGSALLYVQENKPKIEILCYDTYEFKKKVIEESFVGVLPNSFLTRSSEDDDSLFMRLYDVDGNFLGGVISDSLSPCPVKRIKHFTENEYLFFFAKSDDYGYEEPPKLMKFIDINIKSHSCVLHKARRCAFCELGFSPDGDYDGEKLKEFLEKSIQMLEDAKNEGLAIVQNESTKLKERVGEIIEQKKSFLEYVRDNNYKWICSAVEDVLKIYKNDIGNSDEISKLTWESILTHIQKLLETKRYLYFNQDDFKINMKNRYMEFSVKQKQIVDLKEKYFGEGSYTKIMRLYLYDKYCERKGSYFSHCICGDKFILVKSSDLRRKMEVYSLVDGSMIHSRNLKLNGCWEYMRNLNNKQIGVLAYGNCIIVMNLNDYECREFIFDDDVYEFECLNNGLLVMAADVISIWDISQWPFVQIGRIEQPFDDQSLGFKSLIPLSGGCFAAHIVKDMVLKVWSSSDASLLSTYKSNRVIRDFMDVGQDKLVIQLTDYALFYNYRSGEVLYEIGYVGELLWSLVTPDKHFLVQYAHNKVCFYNTNSGYLYAEYATSIKFLQFTLLSGKFYSLKEPKFSFLDVYKFCD